MILEFDQLVLFEPGQPRPSLQGTISNKYHGYHYSVLTFIDHLIDATLLEQENTKCWLNIRYLTPDTKSIFPNFVFSLDRND